MYSVQPKLLKHCTFTIRGVLNTLEQQAPIQKEDWTEILKHMKERMVKETIEVEDPHPMDMEDIEAEDLVVQMSIENLMDWTHLNLTPCSY